MTSIESMNSVEVKDLVRYFGEKKVLDNVSLTVRSGEIFGLLGPSGAGKTTLIRILTGQLKYFGEAKVFNTPCSDLGKDIYRKVGMVMDNCGIYERLSCKDNLKLFAGIFKVESERLHWVLKRVGLEESLNTPAGRLSKGMKQRLLLARAVLHSPGLLFLDEPTGGLDPVTAGQIHEYLRELQENGTTIFLTTHNMEEAAKLCGHIALLNDGKIVEYGVPDHICRKYNETNIIEITLKTGETVRIPNSPAGSDRISGYFREELVETIHSSEPNLETVFIRLTGRGLDA
ncbi:fluoroquinolones export ATP-binding proteinc [Ruminiclostridium hungatei]|uniref:Fluoroquinolones export ATP-binding proteinc n=1 Tax=Ruminiclostridium hungatei TaxID=48256 RepID=A0A1V4SGP2_RUMHU|nr:ABC transporter ATP-binding protein [Ruminiclostridium hungatei]OPX42964.1 fluoroquinolones export ATP-binding proteinc [Ruminiclostridium hungatei]